MATYNTPVIPAADQDAANAFWESAGAGPNNFSVGLVPANGPVDATPTHYFATAQFERYFGAAYSEFEVQFPDAILLVHSGNSASNNIYVNEQLAALNLQRYAVAA
jgi:hypothetical protein